MKTLTIEDTSDCSACTARNVDDLELMAAQRFKRLGPAWCHECGRRFEVLVPETD